MTPEQWRTAWEAYRRLEDVSSSSGKSDLHSLGTDPEVLWHLDRLLHSEALTDAQPAWRVGSIIGRYRITREIGWGSSGQVWEAEDTLLGRAVALKVLHSSVIGKQASSDRFLEEARAASVLNHHNIVTVHEVMEHAGELVIVMERVDGVALRRYAKQMLDSEQILHIGRQVAEALQAAHKRGMIHRDIKPENIMVREDGYVKVVDFGLAHQMVSLSGPDRDRMVEAPAGTLDYMSRSSGEGNDSLRQPISSRWALFYAS